MKYGLFALIFLLTACTIKTEKTEITSKKFDFEITNFTDEQYPDNPDIGFRSKEYNTNYFESGDIDQADDIINLVFYSKGKKDTLSIQNIDLKQFIPTIPKHLEKDEYLSEIALVNQEWNRNQVTFLQKEFQSTNSTIFRMDVARNCLNSYLWEIILYTLEDGSEVPFAHGWFDFPPVFYHDLFKEKNKVDFQTYEKVLKDWKDPENKLVRATLLSEIIKKRKLSFSDESLTMYPLEGARKKKFKEIIYPVTFKTMKDLQSDSTLFATFSQPGYYNRKDPRKTELGRIYNLKNIEVFKTVSKANKDTLHDIRFTFEDKENKRVTHLVLGGLPFKIFPKLSAAKANDGWKNSMGFSNHTFYEKYDEHKSCDTYTNPYFAYLSDKDNKWLDSHKIGIDGPLIHWDDKVKNRLHIWLLSFERHALVGHYVINFKKLD